MSTHRIYLADLDPQLLDSGHLVEVGGDEAHHTLHVRRLEPGDPVEMFNGRGGIAEATISEVYKRRMVVSVDRARTIDRPLPEVILAAPAPKGSRAETLIEQLSQVGASRWIPLVTQRSVVEVRDKRLEKWRTATVVEAAKQCGRAWLLDIDEPTALDECLNRPDEARLLLADAAGGSMNEALGQMDAGRPVLLLVGPEGGFDDAERSAMDAAGAAAVRLGPHILRIETAAVTGAAAILRRSAD